ncbi:MAG: hypothetical protein IJT04_07775 [Bacteroidales bacterium]|nr:hypothetical protein [Bacteroidales bacterium]
MSIKNKAHLIYALNLSGELVSVDTVPSGNNCGCFCPFCKDKLCAKNGGDEEKRIHHFAHQSGADCVGAVESVLHKMAKDILFESKCVFLPKRFDEEGGKLLHFDRVDVEFKDKETQLRPDCIGHYGDKCLWIEFKRTHAVDPKKRGKIISANIDCIEIDLNDCEQNPSAVKWLITCSSENRIWIRDTSLDQKKSRDGYSPKSSDYCEYDNIGAFQQLRRKYAKDECGKLVNLEDGDFNMNEHSYFCLVCGDELTIDVNEDGTYSFTHMTTNDHCEDEVYLHEAAKEIVYDKFIHSNKFEIKIPQRQDCDEKTNCQYASHNCFKENEFSYDLKKLEYIECRKDYNLPDANFQCDLIIKRANTLDNAIIINFIEGDGEDGYKNISSVNYRIIELPVYCEYILDVLRKNPIGGSDFDFINFRNNTETISADEIQHRVLKFQLYYSGKYYIGSVPCTEINKKIRSTVYELIFVSPYLKVDYDGIYSDPDNYVYDRAKYYALYKCLNLKKKACYCELCFFSAEAYGFDHETIISKRYKTKGTPHYPMQTWPIDCPHFSLNRKLIADINSNYSSIKVIER